MGSCDSTQIGVFWWEGKKLHPPSCAVKFAGDETHTVFVVTWLGDLPGPHLTVVRTPLLCLSDDFRVVELSCNCYLVVKIQIWGNFTL